MASQLHRRGVEFDSVTALYKETSYVDQEQDANIALSELDKGHLSESLQSPLCSNSDGLPDSHLL